MPYAGPDTPDQSAITWLIEDIGFCAVWLGDGQDAIDLTDGLARLWFQLALACGWGRRLGFRLLAAEDDNAT